jgi:CRISPR-associated protein Cmr3
MTVWIIEPRDPLIVRDGRPFGPTPGARASSLTFPFPSTITGGVRTRAGLDSTGSFDLSLIPMVKDIGVRGPLLVELDDNGEIETWLCPSPSDALMLESTPPDETRAICKRLVPLEIPSGARTDLDGDLSLVGLVKPDPRKPHAKAPRFWYWDRFKEWLLRSGESTDDHAVILSELGHHGPQPESRTHISIQPEAQVAMEGALFQTRGLEFSRIEYRPEGDVHFRRRMALAAGVDDAASGAEKIRSGLAPLGGERRLVNWLPSRTQLPECPNELRESIVRERHCRVVLLTPAHFKGGSRPAWIVSPQKNVSPHLRALAIGRPQVVSGWDFERPGPKPTRRLAPAGTTLFLQLDGSDESIADWIDAIWMQCVSDDEQDRHDGFGLSVLGAWDGGYRRME